MPTVIDELIVRLGIDGSKFRSDAEKAQTTIGQTGRTAVASGKALEETLHKTQASTDRRLRQTVDVGRTSAQQFSKFRAEVAGLFTTLATGFGLQKFVRDLASTEAGVGRLAKNIGISTNDLNAFQEASKRMGGSSEATGQSLLGLTQQYEQFSITGQSSVLPFLRALHIDWADATGRMRPMVDIMHDLNRAVQGMDKPRANALLSGLGLDQGTITLLEQTTDEYDKLIAHVKGLGVVNEEQAQNAIKFQQKLADLEQAFTTLGRVVLEAGIGPLTEFINEVTRWVSSPENQKFISDEVVEGIKTFGKFIHETIDFLHEWHGAAVMLAEYISVRWLTTMLLGLNPISAMIATIAAGFIALQKAADFFDPSKYSNNSIFWKFISKEDQLKYENSPESRKARGEAEEDPNSISIWHPSTWFRNKQPIASTDMSETQKGFLDTLAGPESGGRYDIKNGGSSFNSFAQFPSGVGAGGTSSASGRYQFTEGTWKDVAEKYGLSDFSPKNQDAAAWFLARDRYKATTGGDLEADLKAGKTKQVAAALGPTWPSLPGGSQSKQTQADFDAALARNSASQSAPATPSTPDDPNAPMHGHIIDPVKSFWNKNFGPSATPPAQSPLPQPDPSLSGYNMGPAQRDAAANQKVSSSSSVETNINGPITINTQAKDADGIAKSLGGSLKKYTFVAQANSGLA